MPIWMANGLFLPTTTRFTTTQPPQAILERLENTEMFRSWFGNSEITTRLYPEATSSQARIRIGRGILVGHSFITLESHPNHLTLITIQIGLDWKIVTLGLIPILIPLLVFLGTDGPAVGLILGGVVMAVVIILLVSPFIWLADSVLKNGIRNAFAQIFDVHITELEREQ